MLTKKHQTQHTDRDNWKKRPISAITKRPELLNFGIKPKKPANIPNKQFKNILETVHNNLMTTMTNNLVTTMGTMPPTTTNHKSRKMSMQLETERVYDDNIKIKTRVNSLQREISSLKSENVKKELECEKKDRLIEEIMDVKSNVLNDDILKRKIHEVKY